MGKYCYFCGVPFKSKKDVHFWTMPYHLLDDSQPVCDKCAIQRDPNMLLELTEPIGVK